MGVFLDNSIKNVVDELNVRYFLPDIQREYVWLKKADEKKIEQLFDSILRDSILLDLFYFGNYKKRI
ncbi:DUF262 domain-containing protein [Helicobacter pylori]|uniref:DUF262 domain-containing protein n=1 Tax=Helicobacter pylori TaxID=210 RepID=UPI0002E8F45D|nr:DUF262 domain-containing protein [Helicobacter pylori]